MARLFQRVNDRLERLGVRITEIVGTMWAALAFAGIALVALPSALSTGSLVVLVAWLSSQFLQLVLLAVILVGQRVNEERHELRDLETHDVVMASHYELTQAHKAHAEKLARIIELLNEDE